MSEANEHATKAILYVDDEQQALKYFQRAFASRYEILTANNAKDGWALMREHADRLAILVTDQRMPGESGTDLLRKARAEHPRIMRILTTAYADLADAIDAVNTGSIYAYITKPWDLEQLRSTVRQAYDYFLLQADRDHLMAEKMTVFHRLLLVDRLRHLTVLAAGLGSVIRRPLAAARAYWEQALALGQTLMASDGTSDDLWQTAIQEAQEVVTVTADLARTAGRTGIAQSTTPLVDLVPGLTGQAVQATLTCRRDLLTLGLASLLQPFSGRVATAIDQGVRIYCTGQVDPRVPFRFFTEDLAVGSDSLLGWFAVYDHGGSISVSPVPAGVELQVDLPQTPLGVLADEDPGWLTKALVAYE